MDSNTLLNISQNMQDLTFVLTNKNYDRIGALSNIDQNTIVYKKTMHGLEISFEVYKELNGITESLWTELTDFKLIWLKETNEYFQICVTTDELSYTKKLVTGKSLCEAELSQVNLYNIEINTEDDITRDDYKVTTFYNMDDPEASLIHRILSKVPQYTIKHVDSSLSKIQRSFSIDGTTILDFLNGECAEQFNCLFTFDSTDRSISVYDLYTVCEDCGERSDMSNFTQIDENGSLTYTCPKCGSHNVKYYGEDTKIFVDNENLTDEVQLETNTDSVKNCFKLVAGDDLMTATVRLLNMNGSDYIYYISDEQKRDMPKELVNKVESYDKLCTSYTAEYESLVSQIYEASEKLYYYKNTMMPTIEHSTVTAATEATKLTVQNLSPVGLSSVTTSTNESTVESALKNYAKVYVKSGYVKLEINDSSYSYVGTDISGNHYGTWTGNFKVTNYSDEEDIAYSPTITVKVYDNYQDFVEQKIKKSILNNANDDDSIFDVLSIDNLDNFKDALTYYCLNRLKSFYDAIQTALDVLVQMNQGGQNAELYSSLYTPYYNKLQACQAEIDKRQVTIEEWQTKYDTALSQHQEIQKTLNFENYIGADLYKLFCCYRREDTYQNDNYICDGLEDQEIIDRAKEFLEVAKKELVKSATMQHSISTNLYNLLLIPEFKPILNSFEVGNWIRVRVDGNIFKLRLIQYEISFSSLNTINVDFSDVTKIHDSVSDFESLVKNTQSMATSYSYISKQADAGHKASVNMDRIVEDGLNSALVNIKNNDREETSFTNHGIICREYDDISDSYSDEQLRITHNILAFTDDNWKTSTLGLGKHEFIRYDGNTFVKDIGYGLSAKFSQNMYAYSGQYIGGDIYSSNYSPTSGSHLDLNSGEFSFAGGKFSYNPNNDKMIMRGVTVEWSTSTPPEIADISGLTQKLDGIDDYLDQLDDRIQTYSQSTDPSADWTTTELKNKHKGDLWFNPDNGLVKRWTGTTWDVITDSELETLAKSKAQIFTSQPKPPYNKGDLWFNGSSDDIMTCIYSRESGAYVSNDWQKRNKYIDMPSVEAKDYQNSSQVTTITENTIKTTNLVAQNLHVNSANIDGLITASQINTVGLIAENISASTISGKTITGCTIYVDDGGKIGNFDISDGELTYGNFGAYGDSTSYSQFMNISPKGKYGFLHRTEDTYTSAYWTIASTAFGVTVNGNVYANKSFILSCDGSDDAVPNVKWVKDNAGGTTGAITAEYATASNGARLIKFSNASSGILTAATPEYVQTYSSPKGHSHSEYASSSHSHSNYVNDASYSLSDSPTTKYSPRYFNVYGNTLSVEGLLISTSSSDERLKKNIRPLRDIKSFYMDLLPVEHEWKDGYITTQKGLQFGLIAQDVENKLYSHGILDSGLVLKENAEEDEQAIHGDTITYKLDKENLHAMHIQMIQSQQKEIESLKQQNISLEGRIAILEQIVNQLSSQINQRTN